MTDTTLIINSLFLLLFLGWSLVIYWRHKEIIKLEKSLKKNEQGLVNKAFKDSEKLLEGTLEKSEEFLKENEHIVEQIKTDLKRTIQELLKDNLESLKGNSEQSTISYKSFLSKSQDIYTKQLSDAVAEMGVQLRKQSQESRVELDKKLNEEYQKMLTDIEQYRQQKRQEIDTNVEKTVSEIVKKVLPQSLSDQDHSALIIQALEAAKKDGFIA